MKRLACALAVTALMAPAGAWAGGQGPKDFTSYDHPVYVQTGKPAQNVFIPGIPVVVSSCCCNGAARSIAFGIATGPKFIEIPAKVDHMVIYQGN